MRMIDIIFTSFFNKRYNLLVIINTRKIAKELHDMMPLYLIMFRLNALSECYLTISYFLHVVFDS